jgi:hypothetical protein
MARQRSEKSTKPRSARRGAASPTDKCRPDTSKSVRSTNGPPTHSDRLLEQPHRRRSRRASQPLRCHPPASAPVPNRPLIYKSLSLANAPSLGIIVAKPGIPHEDKDGDRGAIETYNSRKGRHHTICTKSYGNRVRWPPRPLRYEVDEGVERKIPMICHLGPARCATDRFYNPLILPKLRLSVRFCTNRAVTPEWPDYRTSCRNTSNYG